MLSIASSVPLNAIYAGSVSFFIAMLLVMTKQWHGHATMDPLVGIQKSHLAPTPRVGGVAILAGLIVGCIYAQGDGQSLLWHLIVAGLPAFAFGLLEDVTKRVGVRTRLLATMACGVLAWQLTGFSITNVNVPGFDWLLSFTLISVAFTAFAVGGIANAINIIDGFNGLAAGTVLVILTAFGLIADSLGDAELARACLILAGAVTGFVLLNWPFGKLFLGDGGAYFVGFAIAWLSVLLARNPGISPWAPLVVCGYPILEVMFSILRRHRRNLSPGAADRLHLHSLIKRRLVRRLLPGSGRLLRNSVTGAIMWGAALLPALIGARWSDNTPALIAGLVACAGLYSIAYARLTQFRWHWSPHTWRRPSVGSRTLLRRITTSVGNREREGLPHGTASLEGRRSNLRIAVVANTAWYLYNFRLNLLQSLQDAGYSVVAIAPDDNYATRIQGAGHKFIPVPICGIGVNVLIEIKSVLGIWRALRDERIDVVLSYTPKGNLWRPVHVSLATRPLCNVSGLGRAFVRNSVVTQVARMLYRLTFQRAHHVFFQNYEDMDLFIKSGVVKAEHAERLPGLGVDLARFLPCLPYSGDQRRQSSC